MQRRILVVEDDPEFARFLRTLFDLDRHRVDWVGDCRSARALLEDGGVIDLIALDIWLPDLDGLELCREVKVRPGAPAVLVVTAVPGIDDQAAAAGADMVLCKPVGAAPLRAAVRSLLGHGRRRAR